jgi:hypothetical protein
MKAQKTFEDNNPTVIEMTIPNFLRPFVPGGEARRSDGLQKDVWMLIAEEHSHTQ